MQNFRGQFGRVILEIFEGHKLYNVPFGLAISAHQ
jgi:hypothetical protein